MYHVGEKYSGSSGETGDSGAELVSEGVVALNCCIQASTVSSQVDRRRMPNRIMAGHLGAEYRDPWQGRFVTPFGKCMRD